MQEPLDAAPGILLCLGTANKSKPIATSNVDRQQLHPCQRILLHEGSGASQNRGMERIWQETEGEGEEGQGRTQGGQKGRRQGEGEGDDKAGVTREVKRAQREGAGVAIMRSHLGKAAARRPHIQPTNASNIACDGLGNVSKLLCARRFLQP